MTAKGEDEQRKCFMCNAPVHKVYLGGSLIARLRYDDAAHSEEVARLRGELAKTKSALDLSIFLYKNVERAYDELKRKHMTADDFKEPEVTTPKQEGGGDG